MTPVAWVQKLNLTTLTTSLQKEAPHTGTFIITLHFDMEYSNSSS